MKRKIRAILLLLVMTIALGTGAVVHAAEISNVYVTDSNLTKIRLIPGELTGVKLPLKARSEYVYEPQFTIEADENAPFEISNIKLYKDLGFDVDYVDINDGEITYLTFQIETKETAKKGKYPIYVSYVDNFFVGEEITEDVGFTLTAEITNEKQPAELVISDFSYDGVLKPNMDAKLTFKIKNEGELAAVNTSAALEFGGTSIIPNYTDYNMKLGTIEANKEKTVTVDVHILDTTAQNLLELPVQLKYQDSDGNAFTGSSNNRLYLPIELPKEEEPEESPKPTKTDLIIRDFSYDGVLKPDMDATLTFKVKNDGEYTAINTVVLLEYAGTSIIPATTEYQIKIGTIEPGQEKTVTAKVHILDTTTQSLIELPVELLYEDAAKNEHTAGNRNRLYLPIELPEPEKPEEPEVEDGLILVNGVSQSVTAPKAGQKVTVYFHLENTSSRDYTDIKLSPNYVSRTGFEPVNAEPYQYIGTLKAGERKKVSVTVIAGEEIAGGMNTLDVTYSYVNWKKEELQETVELYVLNVVEKEEEKEEPVVSKPKLMVTDFSTSLEEIKAGELFDFTFSVMNTHEEVAAKNIKVTVTSSNFSVTSGSNSFFVSKIEAGEKAELTINLKASAALTTGAYPISIAMEYEYEGMPTGAGYTDGVQVTEEKMLTVKENLRVSVENISVGDWDIPIVNQATTLSMEVYNMGKSQLNNVYFTVEGDLIIANGSSYYYGNLSAGYPDYVEMSVIPNVSGTANGVLVIHMEDSNGDEVEYRKEFTYQVQEEPVYDWSGEMNGDMGGYMEEPVISEDVKESILPLWAFLLIEAVVFVLAIIVTRKVVLVRYRKKMQKQEEE